jgi:hypothetical protein
LTKLLLIAATLIASAAHVALASAQPTAAPEQRPLNAYDLSLNGFYRINGPVDQGAFGFGALAALGAHVIPQYAAQLVGGIEIVQRSTMSTLLGLGLRRDEADGSSMVRVALCAYFRHPETEGLPRFARRSVKVGMQGRIDVLFRASSAFVGFSYSNVIIDGDMYFSIGFLTAVE